MIYGYMKPNTVTESTERSEEIVSVVYNEYCNYKSILESCIDESCKQILEAKVQVLYEVSIKDIISKIITNIRDWWRRFTKFFKEKIIDKIFNKDIESTVDDIKNKLKSLTHTNESAILTESVKSVKLPKNTMDKSDLLLLINDTAEIIWALTHVFNDGIYKFDANGHLWKDKYNERMDKLEERFKEFKNKCDKIEDSRYEVLDVEYDDRNDNKLAPVLSKIEKVCHNLIYDNDIIKNCTKEANNRIEKIDKLIDKIDTNIKNGTVYKVDSEIDNRTVEDCKYAFNCLKRSREVLFETTKYLAKLEGIIKRDGSEIRGFINSL